VGSQPLLFGAFAFPKNGEPPLSDQELPSAAALAKTLLEVPTSSGAATGVGIDVGRAARLRAVAGEEAVLAIASGVDEQNCEALLPYFDVFLVNSSLLMTLPQKQGRHFLPWTCPHCTVVEHNYPTMCDCCDFDRKDDPSYANALAAAAAAKAIDALDRIDGRKVQRLAAIVHSLTMDDEI
jgi:hypothetical protein